MAKRSAGKKKVSKRSSKKTQKPKAASTARAATADTAPKASTQVNGFAVTKVVSASEFPKLQRRSNVFGPLMERIEGLKDMLGQIDNPAFEIEKPSDKTSEQLYTSVSQAMARTGIKAPSGYAYRRHINRQTGGLIVSLVKRN